VADTSSNGRIGVVMPNHGATADGISAQIVQLEELGFESAWMPGIPNGPDILSLLAIAGRATTRIEIGTAIVPTYPRHPVALAAQALTVNEALGGRLTLGIGVSHQPVIERQYGLDYSQPVGHMREYLQVLRPLLENQTVDFSGKHFKVRTRLNIEQSGLTPPSVLIAALAPQMLRVAGELADGTVTFMTGITTTLAAIVPGINAAAVGRPAPRVVLGMPVCCTDDVAAGRAFANEEFALYGKLPAYQAMMASEGAASPGDVVVIGDEAHIAAAVQRSFAGGITDFQATPFGTPEDIARTLLCLAAIRRQ
jgi:5,10-methylenetetrahydromethanopterin reductase